MKERIMRLRFVFIMTLRNGWVIQMQENRRLIRETISRARNCVHLFIIHSRLLHNNAGQVEVTHDLWNVVWSMISPFSPFGYLTKLVHLQGRGCKAQRWQSCFSSSSLGFDSWHSQTFISMKWRFIDGTGKRKVDRGLKMLIQLF